MYIKGGIFLGVIFRLPYSFSPPPQIVVPSFPCGSKKTSIDVLNDLSTQLRGIWGKVGCNCSLLTGGGLIRPAVTSSESSFLC